MWKCIFIHIRQPDFRTIQQNNCLQRLAVGQILTIPENIMNFCWISVQVATSEWSSKSQSPLWVTQYHTICTAAEHLLVDSGVVLPLPGEAKHATDDSAVKLGPLIVTDLLPFAPILHLHVALCDRDTLAVRWQDRSDARILHLNINVLWGIFWEMCR